MGEANLVNIQSVYAQTNSFYVASDAVSWSLTHNVSSGNETWLVKSLILTNQNANATDTQVYAYHQKTTSPSTIGYLLQYHWLPYKTSLILLDGGTPIYLQYGDRIGGGITTLSGGGGTAGNDLHAVIKYERLIST